jgi:hypothetical protein
VERRDELSAQAWLSVPVLSDSDEVANVSS